MAFRMVLLLIIVVLLCSCASTYYPTFCDIVNSDTLACRPTDPSKDEFDISTIEALGYRCVSEEDWAEGKKRLRIGLDVESLLSGNESNYSPLEGN